MLRSSRRADPQLDRHVLIKLLHPPADAGPDFEQRFRSQIKAVAALRDPHIVQILDFAVADGLPFVVTEYLEGGTLADRLAEYTARHEKMPLAEVDRILESLAGALDAAHRQGIVHGALSPANILFTAHNQPVLTDFGMAAILGPCSLANPVAVGGAPAYLSPEQASGKALEARAMNIRWGRSSTSWWPGVRPSPGIRRPRFSRAASDRGGALAAPA